MTSDIQRAVDWLHAQGKCGSADGKGHLCTLSANHRGRQHETQVMGGVNDGQELAKWPW
jgi:hypothetical protein